jgi:thiol:disulfide interchange protein DsbD
MRSLLLAALVAASAPADAQLFGTHELLEPQQAFRLSARALDERTAELTFHIADGYYMYRDRFRFASEAGVPLSGADIPRGTMKDDPVFGRTEILRNEVRIRLPVPPDAAEERRLSLAVTSQGCADQGVCFLPQKQRVAIDLPAPRRRKE